MVERIRELLTFRQLTPTQFADAIGIARPIVSHILSGRNKPSLEVVQRILAAMPELSMAWLLNGTGPLLAAANPVSLPAQAPASAPATTRPAVEVEPAHETEHISPGPVASAPPASAGGDRRRPAPSLRVAPGSAPRRFAPPLAAPAKEVEPAPMAAAQPAEPHPGPPSRSVPTPQVADALPAAPAPADAPQAPAGGAVPGPDFFPHPEKPIRRIVIFYRDGSFADYRPE